MPATRKGAAAPTVRTEERRGFERVLGHERVISMLNSQRHAGRLAHAYCLIGDEAVGKTTVALALAEELLLEPGRPHRLEVHPDCWLDDRSDAISIDEIRFHREKGALAHDTSLQQFLSLKPFMAASRVAILANAERMTEAAQNCLLKTLEEPPENTVLVLATAYPDHLLPTCLSRCQVLSLGPVPRAELAGWLRDRHGRDDADALAAFAQGRPGLALRAVGDPHWLQRMTAWSAELAPLAFADAGSVLAYAGRFGQGPAAEQRRLAGEAVRAFALWVRDALLLRSGREDLVATLPERREALADWVGRLPADHLRSVLAAAQRTQLSLDQNVNPRLAMEILLLDLRPVKA